MKSRGKKKPPKPMVAITTIHDEGKQAESEVKNNLEAVQQQVQAEKFWAGRNLAARRSARAAA
jgi:hypothetical protein